MRKTLLALLAATLGGGLLVTAADPAAAEEYHWSELINHSDSSKDVAIWRKDMRRTVYVDPGTDFAMICYWDTVGGRKFYGHVYYSNGNGYPADVWAVDVYNQAVVHHC